MFDSHASAWTRPFLSVWTLKLFRLRLIEQRGFHIDSARILQKVHPVLLWFCTDHRALHQVCLPGGKKTTSKCIFGAEKFRNPNLDVRILAWFISFMDVPGFFASESRKCAAFHSMSETASDTTTRTIHQPATKTQDSGSSRL